jgi:glutamyl-tRNA synthetase
LQQKPGPAEGAPFVFDILGGAPPKPFLFCRHSFLFHAMYYFCTMENSAHRKPRVRFAPSPTGPLHIGGVRTALYNYLFARKHGGTCILRIEDTDQTRFVPGAEEYIMEALRWCGIEWQEGQGVGGPHAPYRQSERKEMYREYADRLIHSGMAYYAFDTADELDNVREQMKKAGNPAWQYNHITRVNMKNSLTMPADETQRRLESGEAYVIRMKVPRNETLRLTDIIRGVVVVNTDNIDDKVLFKSDGMPTYHLANVVDDYLMEITHVIRGEEWLPSAPLHVLLYRALGWENQMPQFAHLPLILRPDGNGKLSKRDGDRLGFPVFPLNWTDPATGESSRGYRENGWLPEAVNNIIALLGWHPSDNREVFTTEELVASFSLDRVSKAGAKFDVDKARWFNQYYIREKTAENLWETAKASLNPALLQMPVSQCLKAIALVKDRLQYVNELPAELESLLLPPLKYDQEVVAKKWKADSPAIALQMAEVLRETPVESAQELEVVFKQWMQDAGLGMGAVMPILRICLTGTLAGPAVFDLMELLGKEESVRRIHSALKSLG